MKNFVEPGDILELTAPYAVSSGGGALIGAGLFGVAVDDVANAALGRFVTEGVFDLTKAGSVTFGAGDIAYWDNSAKNITSEDDGNTPIGLVTKAAASGDATVRVLVLRGMRLPGQVLRGTATLDFPSIAAAGQQELTITVTGAEVGDPVAIGVPAGINAGVVITARVSAPDTVTVRASNITAGAIDPASAAYTAHVFRG